MYEYEYFENVNDGIRTKKGYLVATGFNRIVHGERGAYVEFINSQIAGGTFHIPKEQEWRIQGPKSFNAYYIWYETFDGVKVYLQKKRVAYADYVPGRWYISPRDLQGFKRIEGETQWG